MQAKDNFRTGFLAVMMAFFIFGCSKAAEKQRIVIFHGKVEIQEALSDFAAAYAEGNGIEIQVKAVGGGAPYGELLKAEFQSGSAPDIFNIDGDIGYQTWKNKIAAFENQPWMKHTSLMYEADGKTYGFPVAIEGWGMIYNKAMLDQAGIDPEALNSQDAYLQAFALLDAKKEELGLDSVVAMVAGPEMTWTTGLHNFNGYLAGGLPYGDSRIVDMLNNGEVDAQRLAEFGSWVKLLFQYADPRILATGNYDEQIGQFATQKSAFLHQGNWIDPWLAENKIDFAMGMAPHAPGERRI